MMGPTEKECFEKWWYGIQLVPLTANDPPMNKFNIPDKAIAEYLWEDITRFVVDYAEQIYKPTIVLDPVHMNKCTVAKRKKHLRLIKGGKK